MVPRMASVEARTGPHGRAVWLESLAQQARAERRADEIFVEIGLGDDAHHWIAPKPKGDQGGPKRGAGDEAAGAVDRIDHPDELGVGAVVAILLAQHPVLREAGGDGRADSRLGAAVGGGHRIEGAPFGSALVLKAVVGAEQGQDRRPGRAGEVEGEILQV